MKKKIKLTVSILTTCFALFLLAFGVYAALDVNFSMSGKISYQVNDVYVNISADLYKSNTGELVHGGEALDKMLKMVDITPDDPKWPDDIEFVENLGTYSTVDGSGNQTIENIELSFGEDTTYAYFFVISVDNISTADTYACFNSSLTTYKMWQANTNGVVSFKGTKNLIVAYGLMDKTIAIDETFNISIDVGLFKDYGYLEYTNNQDDTVTVTGIDKIKFDAIDGNHKPIVIPDEIDGKRLTAIEGSYDEWENYELFCNAIIIGNNIERITDKDHGTMFYAFRLSNCVFSNKGNLKTIENAPFDDADFDCLIFPESVTRIDGLNYDVGYTQIKYIQKSVNEIINCHGFNTEESVDNFVYVNKENSTFTSEYNGEQVNLVMNKTEKDNPTTIYFGIVNRNTLIPESITTINFLTSQVGRYTSVTIPKNVSKIDERGLAHYFSEIIFKGDLTDNPYTIDTYGTWFFDDGSGESIVVKTITKAGRYYR